MKIFLAIVLLAILSVNARTDESATKLSFLVNKLDDLLLDAYAAKNFKFVNDIEAARDALFFLQAHYEPTSAAFRETIGEMEIELPRLEQMVHSGSTNTRSRLTAPFNFVAKKAALVAGYMGKVLAELGQHGLGGVAASIQKFVEKLMENPQVQAAADGFHILEQGVTMLNKLSGGAFEPLNALSNTLSNIDMVGDMLTSGNLTNTDFLVEAMTKALVNGKSGNAQKIEKALTVICSNYEDAAAATQ